MNLINVAFIFALTSGCCDSFVTPKTQGIRIKSSSLFQSAPYFMEEMKTREDLPASSQVSPKAANKKSSPHQDGIFSPIVLAAKRLLGDDRLIKIRAKGISLHSDVIGSFVETCNSKIGLNVAKLLFLIMDKNRDGKLDKEELAEAFQFLGFDWLQEKQVRGILDRADVNKDGFIDMNEYIAELPKTLRTNLIKLAKKNGGELGFLV